MTSFLGAILNFFGAALTAAFIENILLSHGMDISKAYRYGKKGDQYNVLWYGTLSTIVLTVSSLPLHLASRILSKFKYSFVFTPLIYVFLIAATYFALCIIAKNYLPLLYPKIIKYIPISTFSTGVIAGYMLSQLSYTKLYQTIGFCFGAGIGYTIAMILVIEGAKKISISDVPKPFRGLPIMMIYIGLLSLVIYGLTKELV